MPLRVLAAALLLPLLAGCGAPPVEVLRPRRGHLEQGFREPARARLARRYPVTMPVAGRVAPLELRAGDRVEAGQRLGLVDMEPLDAELRELEATLVELRAEAAEVGDDRLEATFRVGVEREIDAAHDALTASRMQVEAERLRAEQLEKELARDEGLHARKAVTQEHLDRSRLDAQTARIDWRRQGFYTAALEALHTAVELGPRMIDDWLAREAYQLQGLEARLEQVEARLAAARYRRDLAELRAPVAGVVLDRHHDGGAVLAAGTPLLTLGRRQDLEVTADVLSDDARRLGPGTPVVLDEALPATVEALEPQAFTKVSSLGVEQQRVRVRIRPEAPLPEAVGPGYHLEARFRLEAVADALLLPRSAVLEDAARKAYVLVVEGERLARRDVTLGLAGERELQVSAGLQGGEAVVRHPSPEMKPGDPARVSE